jgi:predicted Zn-dependent protease
MSDFGVYRTYWPHQMTYAQSRQIPQMLLFGLSLALACVTLGGCATAPAPAQEFVAQANQLHDGALAQTIIPDRDLKEYIQEVGQRIIDGAREAAPEKASNSFFANVQFHLVDSKVPNVFTTGGKHIYVYAGLFEFCQNEEELATAMSQAYAHLMNLDLERSGLHPDPARPLRSDVWEFVINPFSNAEDLEADKTAFAVFEKSGWDGSKFENLFQRVNDTYHSMPEPNRSSLVERAANAHALSTTATRQGRRPPVADRHTFELLKHQAAVLAAKQTPPPEDETYLLALPNLILSHDLPEQRAAQDLLRPPPPPAVKLEPN